MPEGKFGFLKPNKAKEESQARDFSQGVLDTLAIDRRPTVLDFRGLGEDFSDQALIRWAEREIGIPDGSLESENSPETRKIFSQLNLSYQKAKVFLKDVLRYDSGEINVTDPGVLSTRQDIVRLLRKLRVVKGERGGLNQSARYCRLVKATLAAFEGLKHDAVFLESITEHFENSLVSSDEKRTPLVSAGRHPEGMQFMTLDRDKFVVDGVLSSRSKEFGGVMLRFLIRPEANAESALADGIGVRIIIDKEQATRLVPILCKWFTERMGIKSLEVENGAYFLKKEMSKLRSSLAQLGDKLSISDNGPNPTSSGDFQVFKIKGNLNFSDQDADIIFEGPKGEKKFPRDVSVHARSFEIQLVMPDNKNEREENNHHVYDLKKIITARTRLDGWCPRGTFEDLVLQTANRSGIKPEKVRSYLLGGEKAQIVEVADGREFRYVAWAIYERWKKLGFVTHEQYARLEKARKISGEKYRK